jgi:hypothetical protein
LVDDEDGEVGDEDAEAVEDDDAEDAEVEGAEVEVEGVESPADPASVDGAGDEDVEEAIVADGRAAGVLSASAIAEVAREVGTGASVPVPSGSARAASGGSVAA